MTQEERASAEEKELKLIEKDLKEEGKIQNKIVHFFKKTAKNIKNKTKKMVKKIKKNKTVNALNDKLKGKGNNKTEKKIKGKRTLFGFIKF